MGLKQKQDVSHHEQTSSGLVQGHVFQTEENFRLSKKRHSEVTLDTRVVHGFQLHYGVNVTFREQR